MAMIDASRLWTAQDLFRLPQNQRYEIDEGRLILMDPAGFRHGDVIARVMLVLGVYVRKHKLGQINGAELGVFIDHESPQTLRGADVAFFSNATLQKLGDETGFVDVAPDLVAEVHEASEPDMARKVSQCLRAGVCSVWVIDPEKQTLTKHRKNAPPTLLQGVDAVLDDETLTGFSCRLHELLMD